MYVDQLKNCMIFLEILKFYPFITANYICSYSTYVKSRYNQLVPFK